MINNIWKKIYRVQFSYSTDGYVGIYEIFNGGKWETEGKETYLETDTNGSYTILDEAYINSAWRNNKRYRKYADQHKNSKGYLSEVWRDSIWEITYQDTIDYTYDSIGNKATEIFRKLDTTTYQLNNVYKYVYGDYQLLVSSDSPSENNIQLLFYPNPATSKVTLCISKYPCNWIVYDLTGNKILQKEVSTQETEIDISELTKGIYITTILYKKGILSKKLIKE